ncbi:MAG TPA: tRNA uridine-5-carboxymethylaminomethyl(34) synthesis enzyme MnmG [Firmicutes bacterium]|jgi:tRNA uridine 5-carboxymethylaminomethyl modification enzyme|nr:tRNA uridine-5-carboxymethylaminomethyl(34) synthesis enzyme MnmG [Bacillota bacterium]
MGSSPSFVSVNSCFITYFILTYYKELECLEYDVIVVGAGHAGCEGALAAARLGAKTLIITISPDTIAAMSCNPAIGGPAAKSHLVRELDALGGEMGKIIDRTYLNIRRINESRGPAVLALRAQADKRLYQAEMTLVLEREPNLTVKQGIVCDLLVNEGRVTGVKLKSGRIYQAKAVIIATGTFLNADIVMGNIRYQGGRQGEPAAVELSASLKSHGLILRRFQTATPPRIHNQSVNYAKMSPQKLQEPEWGYSWDGLNQKRPQVPCWVTMTTPQTIATIVENLNTSPIRSGVITSKGPHFCPSIDRKVINFPKKTDHLIFIEPEGRYTEELYLLGMTTAMPEEIQEKILATIPGLENSQIIRPGYAVEYDCLDSFQFKPSLENRKIENLFTAGQINGTSGYEEAAVQGLVAGINSARKIQGLAPYIPDRTTSYIGVLIDDLTTLGTEEPYRMMTSLAEFRLFLRLDNSLARLGQSGFELGLNSPERWNQLKQLLNVGNDLLKLISQTKISAESDLWQRLKLPQPERGYRLKELILRPEFTDEIILGEFPKLRNYPQPIREYIWNEAKLAGYIERQQDMRNQISQFNQIQIDPDTAADFNGLSESGRNDLRRVKPITLGQAFRIPTLSAADRTLLLMKCKNRQAEGAGYGAAV